MMALDKKENEMKRARAFAIVIVVMSFAILACGSATPTVSLEPTTTVEPTFVPSAEPEPEATKTLIPTKGPTATPWPPVFDLWSLQDLRKLDSFVVTINEKNTVNGQLTERTFTIGYIQEPYSAYRVLEYNGGVNKAYVLNDRVYELTGSGDWYISVGKGDEIFSDADPARYAGKLMEATFTGEEEYEGIATYHFVLDAANSTESNANYQVGGELYLAKEGNYILFSNQVETSKQGDFSQIFEMTETLSSINELTEIKLPADMEEMVPTSDLPFTLGLPLPPTSAFFGMIRYKNGSGVDTYTLTTPKTSIEEFLNYYRNLPPTDGWTVSHVGHVTLHESDCEFTRECVIINNGNTQVILYYNGGSIRAEFDWPHLYSPLK